MTHTTDQQAACSGCHHPQHAPGTECEAGVEHGPHRWHRCLCLNQPGADRACPPQMDCQGGSLGWGDVWYLRQGQNLRGVNGETITPDVLREPAPVSPPADPTGLRDRIAAALYEHMHPGSHWSDTSMPSDWRPTYLEEADAVLAVLPETADQTAEIERMREQHMASLRRADEINNDLMEEVQRYAAGTERPVLWSVYNRMHGRALDAEAAIKRLRRLHDGLDAETALTSPDDEITRGAAARKIAAALDGWTDPAVLPPPADRAAVSRELVISALHDARRNGLGGMTEAEAVEHMADTVLRRVTAETPKLPPMDPVHILGIGAAETETPTAVPERPASTALRIRVLTEILDRLLGGGQSGDSATEQVGAAQVRAVLAEILADMQRPVVGDQPDVQDADRIVAYVPTARTELYCLRCAPNPAGDIWTPVTSAELEDGGICTVCGADVLIPQETPRG